ncbi:Imm6 family immunity protein [Listeria valentina]|uniref:Imm6 family immunity protein n=1 Tax=Listeria valentina TaxID=2705293 RepID=UPI0014317D2E|nr:Imm6 family immunity protein [Listeria valentina]
MFQDWKKLQTEAKAVYFLGLCDTITPRLKQSKSYKYIIAALDSCWQWVIEKNVEADDLYFYLENLEDTGVLTLMQFPENEENLDVWVCVADALLFTIYCAYKYQGDEYLPETVESIDYEELFAEFQNHFKVANMNSVTLEKKLTESLKDFDVKRSLREDINKLLS